jgi:hypothetical protein
MCARQSSAWATPRSPCGVGALDDFERHLCFHTNGLCGDGTLIPAIGDSTRERRKHPPRNLEHRRDHVAVLNISRRDAQADHQPKRIDRDVTLLALCFLARIVAGRIDIEPPFSALLTLWLSTIAVVAVRSLPSSSRTSA